MLALLKEASIFADRYKVGRCIASGGMGAVYEVEHLETERRAALKVLLPHVLANESAREQFKAEAKVAAKLRSEHVVDILDAGVDAATDMPYLVMELLEGEDLGARIHRVGPLPGAEAVLYLDQVARALDRLHSRSIVHRDLKPENLFLTERDDGSPLVKVLDFGIAKVLAGGSSGVLTDQARGTPIYMSPEQFRHAIQITPATDLYSLGMVAFTLLVGDPYWGPELDQGMNVFVIARLAEAGPKEAASVRASARGVALPAAFDAWFARITASEPDVRFARAAEAVHALAEALGVPFSARADRPSFFGRESRPSDEHALSPASPRAHPVPPESSRDRGPSSAAPTSAGHRVIAVRGSSAAPDVPTLPNGLDPAPAGDVEDANSIRRARALTDLAPSSDGTIEAGMSRTRVGPSLPPPGQRDRTGIAVLTLALIAAATVLVFLMWRGPSGVPAGAPGAPAVAALAPAPTSEVTVVPAPSGTVPVEPATEPSPAAPHSSSAPASTAPANVPSSPSGVARPLRPNREVPAGPTPIVPAKKPKYTQD